MGTHVADLLTDMLHDVTGADARSFTPHTRLLELPLESLGAVRVRARIAQQFGVDVPMSEFYGERTVTDLVTAVDNLVTQHERVPAHADTTPNSTSTPVTMPDDALPRTQPDAGSDGRTAGDDVSLTDVQSAYWVGRDPGMPLGGVATYWFNEYELDLVHVTERFGDVATYLARVEAAWQRLIAHHPMLRMEVTPQGTQRIRDHLEWCLPRSDLRQDARASERAQQLRDQHSHRVLTRDGQLFFVYAIVLPTAVRIQVGFDAIAVDLASWQLLMRQWGELVADPDRPLPELPFTFFEHLDTCQRDPQRQRKADRDLTWWTQRAATLPPAPELPMRPDRQAPDPTQPSATSDQNASDVTHRFTRHSARLEAPIWERVQQHAQEYGVTSSTVALAVFSLMLEQHTGSTGMTLSATLSQRPERDGSGQVVGDFAQTGLLALPCSRRSEGVTFGRYAEAVRESFFDTIGHADVSSLAVTRSMGAAAGAYPVVFTSGLGRDVALWDRWLGRRIFGVSQTPQVLVDHLVWEEDGELVVVLDSVDDHLAEGFTEGLLNAMMNNYRTLDDARAWQDVRLGWDPSGRLPQPPARDPFGAGPLLHDPLWAQVTTASGAPTRQVAVRCGEAELTFAALGERAQAVAEHLNAAHVRAGEAVLVIGGKSCGQIVAVAGVMRSGAAYIPVDPAWPQNRIESVVAKSGARLAVTVGEVTVPAQVSQIACDEMGQVVSAVSESGHRPSALPVPNPDDLAYAIFTSGSTGTPKGVAETHAQVRTTLNDVVTRFHLSADDAVLGVSALSFDLSVFDIFGVLGVGAKLVLPDATALRDPAAWCALIEREGVTVWNSAPALLEMLVEYAEHDPKAARQLASLRLVMLSGDWIPVTLPDRLRAVVPGLSFNSLGGATEASIWSITYPVGDVDPTWPSIPYGRALAGQSFYVLDDDLAPVSVGESGELFIGGDGVASGYLSDPEQTASRFITHPVLGERLYRTGDLGRWRRDGNIEFLGRVDRQVKIGGFRIELGEVESAFARCRNVRQAVAASVAGPDGRPRLVAWVAGHDLTVSALRRELTEHLPTYMIPSRFEVMDALPVTENGKVDYKGLVSPFDAAPQQVRTGHPEPSGPGEGGVAVHAADRDVDQKSSDGAFIAPSKSDVVRQADADPPGGCPPPAWACLVDVLQRQPDASATLLGQGVTSLELIRVANALEERFGSRPNVAGMMQHPVQHWLTQWAATLPTPDDAQSAAAGSADTAVSPSESRGEKAAPEDADPPLTPVPEAFPAPPTSAQLTVTRAPAPRPDDLIALGEWLQQVEAWGRAQHRQVTTVWAEGEALLLLSVGEPSSRTVAQPPTPPRGAATRTSSSVPSGSVDSDAGDSDDSVSWPGQAAHSSQEQPQRATDQSAALATPDVDGRAPFALTEMQLAYLVGRADDWLGAPVGPHYYTEAEFPHLDPARVQRAVDAVVRRHPMLRARATGDARQYILSADDPSARVVVRHHDFTSLTGDEARTALTQVREALSHRVIDPLAAPGLDVHVSTLPTGVTVLHFGVDLLFVDAASAVMVVDELRASYEGREVPEQRASFAAWIDQTHRAGGAQQDEARAYFASEAKRLPAAPHLPVTPTGHVRVRRHERSLTAAQWQDVQAQARGHHVTPIAVLLTALGAVLSPVSDADGCSVVMTVFNRPDEQTGVVGDYTSTLLTALPQPTKPFAQLAQDVSAHVVAGLAHAVGAHGIHGNEVMRMVAEAGGSRRFPVAFSSGLGTTRGADGGARDAGRLLDGWGRTTYAISQTPHVVIDVQTFEADGHLMLRWDAIDDVLPAGWVDAAFAAYVETVEALAQESAWGRRPHRVQLPTADVSSTPAAQPSAPRISAAPAQPEEQGTHVDGERSLTAQLRHLLGRQLGFALHISDEDTSFFELGASSVDLVAWHGALSARGFDLSVIDLFAHPTLTRLARLLTAKASSVGSVVAAPIHLDQPVQLGEPDQQGSAWSPRGQARQPGGDPVQGAAGERSARASRAARRMRARAVARHG